MGATYSILISPGTCEVLFFAFAQKPNTRRALRERLNDCARRMLEHGQNSSSSYLDTARPQPHKGNEPPSPPCPDQSTTATSLSAASAQLKHFYPSSVDAA